MLGQLPKSTDSNVLIDSSHADDAGVYRISDETAVVLTADYFTPIVDDPYWYGAIAAANSLSDIYAMGGRPVAALNIAAFPGDEAFKPYARKIMQGGIDKMTEAGVSIIGGHTIKDKEPKYGFTVMGLIHPQKIFDNTKARKGDALVLTKPLGTGIIATGVKANICSPETISEFTKIMASLNRKASEIMVETGVSTATDITGFGLIGHLHEVLSASNCTARLFAKNVPFFPDALRIIDSGKIPGGTRANESCFEPHVHWDPNIPASHRILMHDAQTSGGLLIFVPSHLRDHLASALIEKGIMAAHIGDIIAEGERGGKRIIVEP